MTVKCMMTQCPYYDIRGFCAKGVVAIDENGMCKVLWKHGQQRKLLAPISEQYYPKHPIQILQNENVSDWKPAEAVPPQPKEEQENLTKQLIKSEKEDENTDRADSEEK